jgi:hypothetical protein
MCDREQELLIRVGALNLVLQKCLEELTVQYGVNAKTKLRAIRDELIQVQAEWDFPRAGA